MITKQLSLCTRCHKPQAGHYWVNEAQFGKWLLVCPTATGQAPQEPNPQNVEKNPQRKDYGVYSPEVERDLSERYTTEAADVGVTAVEDLSAQATDAMNAGDYVRATHLWIRKVDTVYRELKQTESALATTTRELVAARQESDQWQAAAHAKEVSRAEAQGRWLSMRQQRDDTEAQLVVVTRERDEANVKLDALLRRFPTDPPAVGVELSCLLCGQVKPWATWYLGTAVCLDCRDARFRPTAEQLVKVAAERDRARDQLAGCCACQHDGRGALTSECQEHQEQWEALAALQTALALLVDYLDRLPKEKR